MGNIRHVMVGDFQPQGRKDLSTLDRWRLKRKTREFCGAPVSFGQVTPFSVLILRHVSDSNSFRYQASILDNCLMQNKEHHKILDSLTI